MYLCVHVCWFTFTQTHTSTAGMISRVSTEVCSSMGLVRLVAGLQYKLGCSGQAILSPIGLLTVPVLFSNIVSLKFGNYSVYLNTLSMG